MTSGELDQDAAAFDVGKDIQNYLWRIGGKTAALFANATEGGAILAGCSESTVEALRVYGYSAGMAFQIVDDILDYTGDEAEMGKPVGSDLREGTITLPGLLLLERYPRDNPIKRFFGARPKAKEERLQEAITSVRESDVLEESMDMARDYIRRAEDAIRFLPESEAKACLSEIGDYILRRRS
jgi:octaprenyl-diphosphate synthase